MNESQSKLSASSVVILEMIAAGNSYEQILADHTDYTYHHIFLAAREALSMSSGGQEPHNPTYTLAEKRERHLRAYEKWTDQEDVDLRQLIRSGGTVAQIAGRLQRNRGAIRSRIMKLNLVADLSTKEQERFHRIVEHDGEPSDDK